jgi:AraC-like DNA-binding protein
VKARAFGTVLVTLPRILCAYAAERGLDPRELAARVGLDPLPASNDARVPREKIDALFDLVSARLGDPALGLHFALAMPPGNTGVFEVVAQTAPTRRVALQHLCRYWHLLNDGVDVAIESTRSETCLTLRTRAPKPLARAWIDLTVVALGVTAAKTIDRPRPVPFVGLPYPEDEAGRSIGQLLSTNVRFDAPCLQMGIDRDSLDEPLLNRNEMLQRLAVTHADALMAGVRGAQDDPGKLVARVEEVVRARLVSFDASVEGVAKALGTSPRTLQRRLQTQGTGLRAVVEQARKRIAIAELEKAEMPITDIAFLLGFSETSAFDRAFRRWTGASPSAFRAERTSTRRP